MKVLRAEFLEGVETPLSGPGGSDRIERFRHAEPTEGKPRPITGRVLGPGIMLEVEGQEDAVVVAWANVKFARVRLEPGEQAKAKK
jgi:hypothetical protein